MSTPPENSSDPSRPRARRRPLLRLGFVALLVGLDLWTKHAVFGWLDQLPGRTPPEGVETWFNGHWRFPVIGDFLGLMLSLNKGAAWGVGESVPWLLVGGRFIAVIVLGVLLLRAPVRPRMMLWAYVLVLSGALGNLYDNLFREPDDGHPFGSVRDFIHVYFERWDYHFPTFNVADSCITVGAVLLIASGLFPVPDDAADDGVGSGKAAAGSNAGA